jgi:hypothetical protein
MATSATAPGEQLRAIQVQGMPASASIAGSDHTACSLGTKQSIYCLGDNGYGQFGNGTHVPGLVSVQINP